MIASLLAVASLVGQLKEVGPAPSPALGPAQVVQIQLDALRLNDKPSKDAGIAVAFRFASPRNRQATGPLANFTQIVRSPGYLPMIGHRIAGTGPLTIVAGVAVQRATIVAADGQAYEYEFQLSRDPASGCWFTEGVVPIPKVKPTDKGVLS